MHGHLQLIKIARTGQLDVVYALDECEGNERKRGGEHERAFTPISHNTFECLMYNMSWVTINQHNLFDYYANCIEDLPFYFEHRTLCSKVIILLCVVAVGIIRCV